VPRNIDGQLLEALEDDKNFVLVVGEARAGKTRTAYEALLRVAPSTLMVVPSRAEDLGEIIHELKSWSGRPSRAELWLNDIDKFLNKGTLTWRVANTAIRELGMQIVATMRRKEFNGFEERDDEIARDAQEVLNRAKVIKLDERMTPKEEQLARKAYPDLNLGPGLGESFIAGRKLRQRYDYGEPAMRAVVRAANDWRRAGFTAPIQRDDLFYLFKPHFEDLAPAEDVTEEVFKTAVEDARKPVVRYSALLNRERSAKGKEEYYVVDYVSDYLENEDYPIVEEAWKLALKRLQSEPECVAVRIAAYDRGRSDTAERAWVTCVGYSSAVCAIYLGKLLEEQGRPQEAEKAYREAIRINPQDALAHSYLGKLLEEQGRPQEAEKVYREAIRINPQDALAHYNLGILLTEQGRPQEFSSQLLLGSFRGSQIYALPGDSAFFYNSGMEIYADGAYRAYHPDGQSGLDNLANAGQPGNWWGVVTDNGLPNGNPVIQTANDPAPGFYVSPTSLEDPRRDRKDPRRYVNSEAVNYLVIPRGLNAEFGKLSPILGDFAVVIGSRTGAIAYALVGFLGPKIGAGSIALAAALGIPSSPKIGGVSRGIVYIVFPGSSQGWPLSQEEIDQKGAELFSKWGGMAEAKQCFPDLTVQCGNGARS
jgi:tetratricopeptide (TPR) repeat protein